jgi:O-Antigen ligase/Tetratricopeptide repeat
MRALAGRPSIAAGLFGAALVLGLALADGGYWPSAWSWTTLALAWVAAVALAIAPRATIPPSFLAVLGALAAFAGWAFASLLWTDSISRTALDGQRAAMYVVVAFVAALVVGANTYIALLGGVWAAASAAAVVGLATVVVPDRLGVFDQVAGSRLSEPLGYSNAVGLLCALGAILALGLACGATTRPVRGLAAASIPVLATTLYFTFSRGAWLVLVAGIAVAVALDRRRLRLVTAAMALAPFTAIPVAAGFTSDALTRRGAPLGEAAADGHRVAILIVIAALASGVVGVVIPTVERRIRVTPAVRRTYAAGLLVVVLAAAVTFFVRFGGPITVAEKAWEAFSATAPAERDLNRRLFVFSGSDRASHYEVAWAQFRDEPLVGTGAGTYELWWARERPLAITIHDAHSLYLEVLGELGVVGLALLLVALAIPLVIGIKARGQPLVPVALAAYAAYLLRAGIDWDWEMPAVTIAGLLAGFAAARAGSTRTSSRPMRSRGRWALAVACATVAAAAIIGLAGNGAITAAREARADGLWEQSRADAERAMDWMPWSSDPWQLAGEADLARGRATSARTAFRTAIAKDPADWELWFGLARSSRGGERRVAAERALELNPRAPELAQLRRELRNESR